jgi:hypothetical protein
MAILAATRPNVVAQRRAQTLYRKSPISFEAARVRTSAIPRSAPQRGTALYINFSGRLRRPGERRRAHVGTA